MGKTEYSLPPLKSLGQNFLQDKKIIEKILGQAKLSKKDTVLEIGPGHGELTLPLAQKVSQVIAIEIDRGLAARLKKIVPKNVQVVHADARRLDFAKLGLVSGQYLVVANLPFNVGTVIIRRLLECETAPRRLVVILQNEVVDRILAKNSKESVLSLAVKYYGQARRLFSIPKNAYYPAPKVDTSVLEIELYSSESKRPPAEQVFSIVKAGFSSRRKYLLKNLCRQTGVSIIEAQKAFAAVGLSIRARAEDLSFSQWLSLVGFLKPGCGKDRN
jgi:16S rRNA (adenine1518-N6/adenine1519-N6)-dimethyltransferase